MLPQVTITPRTTYRHPARTQSGIRKTSALLPKSIAHRPRKEPVLAQSEHGMKKWPAQVLKLLESKLGSVELIATESNQFDMDIRGRPWSSLDLGLSRKRLLESLAGRY